MKINASRDAGAFAGIETYEVAGGGVRRDLPRMPSKAST